MKGVEVGNQNLLIEQNQLAIDLAKAELREEISQKEKLKLDIYGIDYSKKLIQIAQNNFLSLFKKKGNFISQLRLWNEAGSNTNNKLN